jgi:cytochrome c553
MTRFQSALASVLVLAASATTWAQDRDALVLRSLAATCANCHGTNGRAVEGSSVPTIAGMPKAYLATQLKAFKAGERPATIMHQLSKGYSDAQIEQLASYFAVQKAK